MQELPKQYRPAEHEGEVFAAWLEAGAFHADPGRVARGEAPAFCVLIPPPNVTAGLHLGHALNNTLQDVLVRAHRMMGFEALWMPGTDHAGIATQTVVEKRLLQTEGKRRTDYQRDEFVGKVQAFKDEYEAKITDQLRRMGASCDWVRQRFTMDEVCARGVREAFFRLFRDELIYRGKRLVNWDPVTQTALADDEVEMEEVEGSFWYLRYPLVHPPENADDPKDVQEVSWSELAARGYPGADRASDDEQPAWITVATTRPETYLGDTAVAINPNDPRATALRGLMVQLPIVGRVIPIVEDSYVVMPDPGSGDAKAKYATGFLKVTPAHDPNDWEIGRRHNLRVINVMAPDASISDQHGWQREAWKENGTVFIGKSREEARDLVVREFKDRNLLEAVRPYSHAVGHSYRSHVPIEPYLSDQWYVRVTDERLVGAAQRALAPEQRELFKETRAAAPTDGAVRFFPDRYAKTYEQWHENLRDWCISRQLWWGHRVPVWRAREIKPDEFEGVIDPRTAWKIFSVHADRLLQEGRIAIQSPRTDVGSDADTAKPMDTHMNYVCVRSAEDAEAIEILERSGFEQDPDVLDTWFSSALWPLSTMGWPDPERAAADTGVGDFPQLLGVFNPTSVLSTGREIITLWVSRMVMFNRYFLAEADNTDAGSARAPFRDVFIHAMVQDGEGQKMSKSLGNGVDPLDIVESHGADALRLSMCQLATSTQDVRVPLDPVCPHCQTSLEAKKITTAAGHVVQAPEQKCPSCGKMMLTPYGLFLGKEQPTSEKPLARLVSPRFDASRNFCNKLWNAARFAISMLEGKEPGRIASLDELSLPDRWMLSRLAWSIEEATRAIRGYHFAVYAQTAYDLLWRDFCDWYVESIKHTASEDAGQRAVLRAVLDVILRVLHPAAPFITEAIYQHVRRLPAGEVPGLTLGACRRGELLCTAAWPIADPSLRDDEAAGRFDRLKEVVTAVREVRAQQGVKPKWRVTLHVPGEMAAELDRVETVAASLAGLGAITSDPPPGRAAAFTALGQTLHLSNLSEAVDTQTEIAAITKHADDLAKRIKNHEGRLANKGYVERAPAHLVEQTKEELAALQAELAAARRTLAELGG